MHERLRRAFAAVILLCIVLSPAAGSLAGPQEQLDDTEGRLESLRQRMDRHQDQASGLRDRIDELNRIITELQIIINELDVKIAKVEAEVRSVRAEIARTKGQIEGIEKVAIEQATALYKSGSTDTLDALLNVRSISQLNDRLEMMGVAAEENTGALVRFGRLKARLEAQSRELFEREQELTAAREQQANVLTQRDDVRERLADDLRTLQDRLGQEKAQEGDLENRAADLKQEILAAQARSTVAPAGTAVPSQSLGTSSAGFIWPLNGGITSGYGYRWGGMHTGIDIDGVGGQPIVAARSGRVIMAGAYSGYGNAVIIDHGSGLSTLYGHMSGFATSSGAGVSQGQVIGYVGCTGSCTGDHLHFEVRVNGNPVDPMGYLP
ncbi:MAG: murein hydrolase activator EnvC family protein [Actinomycetota bacterium]